MVTMPRNVRDILAEHKADLESRLKTLRAQIIPLERELAEVNRARSAVVMVDYGPEQTQIDFLKRDAVPTSIGERSEPRLDQVSTRSPYQRLTIKDLVRKALAEQFERGATANELRDFFADAWRRTEISRTSLSPQLSRMKQDGEIILIGRKWALPTSHNRADEEADTSPNNAATGL